MTRSRTPDCRLLASPAPMRTRTLEVTRIFCAGLFVLAATAGSISAQEISLDFPRPTENSHAQRVTVDEDPQAIVAGRADWIELRFHVAPGFHINSHTPHDEMLIPTSLEVPRSSMYQVQQEIYPAGEPLRLSIGTGETLSTYTGGFRIRVQVTAPKGENTFVGALHYQACNAASCFPAHTLPVRVSLVAR